jgi:hypothetical protein
MAGQEALLLLHKEVQQWHEHCASSFQVLFIMSPAGAMPAKPFIFQIPIATIFETFSIE